MNAGPAPGAGAEPLLSVRDLHVSYPVRGFRRPPAQVIKGVSLDVARGETVGLVGESGSGKTTLGRAVLGLAPVSAGQVLFEGRDIGRLSRAQRRSMARDVQVVFQDPYSSLNPAMTIEDVLSEPLLANGVRTGRETVRELLDAVHLPADAGSRLAREFSGGQRQRIAIARALALSPKLIICDEPTSALDLSTQARILDLLLEIQQRTEVSYLFITHDLAVVRAVSHRIAVLWHGELVEVGTAAQVSDAPHHPYTQRLQMAAPVADPVRQAARRDERRRLLQQDDWPALDQAAP
ncbi:ATP-binding cassette domain-containing protein [Modestobacter roseus]|uniref:Peptide/nickel transport system ATP-binding protein n=1 Tax=Modestobacter roseus TaxID=1181884 RepID=A0A562IRB7_9ACTN|nr:ATP-binding cassette domain-containing protein [Modestobacter roseus]TWH73263.1 peptide/nickel transport system ATP-binding protein [Modestobacter roseus]